MNKDLKLVFYALIAPVLAIILNIVMIVIYPTIELSVSNVIGPFSTKIAYFCFTFIVLLLYKNIEE